MTHSRGYSTNNHRHCLHFYEMTEENNLFLIFASTMGLCSLAYAGDHDPGTKYSGAYSLELPYL